MFTPRREGIRLVKPRTGGRQPVRVGATLYGVMPGSRIAHSADDRVAWVLDITGEVLLLTERGQVEPVSPAVQAMVRRQKFGLDE